MSPRSAQDTPQKFDGWFVVGAVFVSLMVNSGLGFYGLAVYLEAITDEYGLSVSSVSLATSMFFVVSAVTGRLIAPVIQERDLRISVGVGGVIMALGLILIGRSTRLLTLYPSYVIFAVGTGLSGLVPSTTLVTRWFQQKRSVALSVASTGLSVGGLTITVFAAWWIDRRGMAGAMPLLALIALVVISATLLWMWPDPAARGQAPDGDGSPAAVAAGASGVGYEEAVRSIFFVLVTVAFVFAMAAQVGGIAQLAKMGTERVDAATGTLLVSVVAGTSVIFRLIGGVVASRVKLITFTGTLAVIQGVALFMMSGGASRTELVIATAVFGATIGNLLMLQPLVLADRFGVTNYPRIYSFCQLIVTGLGVAGGPYLLGVLRDQWSYEVSYVVAGIGSVIAGVVFFAAWHFDTA